MNGSTPDLKAKRAELVSINTQISNGLKAILSGLAIPELRGEMDRLRVCKIELEDIINHRTAHRRPVDPKAIVRIFEESLEKWDTNLPEMIKEHVAKIYAHTDGSCSVNAGVHLIGISG